MVRNRRIGRYTTRKLIYGVIALVVAVIVIKSVASSLFISRPDRLNIVFTGESTVFYSFGLTDNVNYVVYFPADLKLIVPGGYGYYRAGALGKLALLEKKPDLVGKAFSVATSNFTSFYFFPKKTDIFYGEETPDSIKFPSLTDLYLYSSNASLLDRTYLSLLFLMGKKNDFSLIRTFVTSQNEKKVKAFSQQEFAKEYQGYFYHKTYRTEKRNVQIIYTKSFKTAEKISNILEGSGIRVVDITQKEYTSRCKIVENNDKFSKTARTLAAFFNCHLEQGNAPISDILLYLGDLEKSWEIN